MSLQCGGATAVPPNTAATFANTNGDSVFDKSPLLYVTDYTSISKDLLY